MNIVHPDSNGRIDYAAPNMPLRTRLHNWLICRLVGNKPVVLNVRIAPMLVFPGDKTVLVRNLRSPLFSNVEFGTSSHFHPGSGDHHYGTMFSGRNK